MKKVVILGVEGTHADHCVEMTRRYEKYGDVEFIGVYSDEPDANKRLNDKYGIPVMSSYDEAVGKVDGVIVVARNGHNHYKYAKPYIQSGVPMFIDKPITASEEDALALMRECRAAGVKVTTGSCTLYHKHIKTLKSEHEQNYNGITIGGYVRGPVKLDSPYAGIYFYANHMVDPVLEIFGKYPKSVKAYKNGGEITVVFRYEKYDIVGLYDSYQGGKFYALRMSERGGHGEDFSDLMPAHEEQFGVFYDVLCGGDMPLSYKDTIASVFVVNAIIRSLESGNEEAVKEYEI